MTLWVELLIHWKRTLTGAVIGAITFVLLPEVIRWWLGKGFFE